MTVSKSTKKQESPVGIVMSGGGARGAYEVGVIAGIVEALGLTHADKAPFSIFAGTSVGAINSAYLASNAHHGDFRIEQLVRLWSSLELRHHLRIDVAGLLGMRGPGARGPFRRKPKRIPKRFGHYALDPRPLEEVVEQNVSWRRLHRNVREGTVRALIVAALHIGTGRTAMFAELAPGVDFKPSRDPRRIPRVEPITADHVLGSAAIPLVFPARRVGDLYYCDGGIRFNTPMSPAIRAGADRLVVISLLRQPKHPVEPDANRDQYFPHPAFLMGKIMNALLLDPVAYDLYVLERFNRLLEVLESTVGAETMATVNEEISKSRGTGYRSIETLVFTPSDDIGRLASEHLAASKSFGSGRLRYWLLGRAGDNDATWEADLASYILFDGGFASRLIAMGRRDALRRRDEIRDFFLTGK